MDAKEEAAGEVLDVKPGGRRSLRAETKASDTTVCEEGDKEANCVFLCFVFLVKTPGMGWGSQGMKSTDRCSIFRIG